MSPLSLSADQGEVKSIYGDGTGRQQELDIELLSAIVDTLNEPFGLNLNERDQLLFDQFEETWLADDDVVARARNNTLDNFRLVFDREFLKTLIGRMQGIEAIVSRILDDEDFGDALMDLYARLVYQRARNETAEENGAQ
jgi:type I restriction enzyme, R subunit